MRKAKFGITAMLIIGIVFTLIGGIECICGLITFLCVSDDLGYLFLYIFVGNGLLFFILGVLFLSYEINRRLRANRLLNSGNFVLAEISDVTMQYFVRVGFRHPYIILCKYQDALGEIHTFKSRELLHIHRSLLSGRSLLGQKVKVYVEDKNLKHYYVDIDEVL